MPRLVSIIGGEYSERNALIHYIIQEFRRRNNRVSLVKKAPDTEFIEIKNKGLWRIYDAGPETIAITSLGEIAFFMRRKMKLSEVLSFLHEVDYVLLDEFQEEKNIVKIVMARNADEAAELSDDLTIALSGQIAESEREIGKASLLKIPVINYKSETSKLADIIEQKALPLLPGFLRCGECGYESCYEFAKAIVTGSIPLKECPLLAREDVILETNGERIPLKAFPRDIIKNVIMGITSSLKDVKETNEIKIVIKRRTLIP
ncbi:MAG: molybdopterin-guanine dinucleotide biosynthesis protein MobB [Candidatus Bathyarchaeia archaeon]